jgi:benzoyl-CoA reductase subunit C
VPEELLHAAGYFPVRVLGWSRGTHRADGLLQSFACSLARGALDAALSGDVDFLDLIVFAHTCDTIQNLTDIWRRNVPKMRAIVLSTPVLTTGEAPFMFFRSALSRGRASLEEESGPIPDEALWANINLYEKHRSMMRLLYRLRRNHPWSLSAERMLCVVLSSFLIRKEDHLPLLEQLIRAVESQPKAKADDRPKVFVAGSVCQSAQYMAAIEEAGCLVADDDLCTGSRAFAAEAPSEDNPIDCLARMYLARSPCPAKHTPGYDPGADILAQAHRAGADGVIFLFTKFCDPWSFDYPHVRRTLANASMPSLLIEIEQHLPPSGNFTTRVATFAEMLEAARKGKAPL